MQDASNLPGNVAGQFSDGNPATGTDGTTVLSQFMNDLMNNILYVISQAGTGLTDDDQTDLATAIRALLVIGDIANLSAQHNADGTHKSTTHDGVIRVTRNTSTFDAFAGKQLGDAVDRFGIDADGRYDMGDGTNPVDITLQRSAGDYTITLGSGKKVDINRALDVTEDIDTAGDINLVTGKSLFAPDASSGSSNSGKFFGGNGSFMWFDGVSNGTTAVTLATAASTFDWRDRWVVAIAFLVTSATPNDWLPGGSSDSGIWGNIQFDGATLVANNKSDTIFYSEAGSAGGGSTPSGVLQFGSDTLQIYADSTTGDLKIEKVADTGNEYAFGILVIASDDQGHV